MLGVRLDDEQEARLSALAKKTRRSKSYLAKEALRLYIEAEESNDFENQQALARWKHYQETGESIRNEDMMDWLKSWGSDQEKSCPAK